MHFGDLQTVNRCLFFLFSYLGCDKLFAGWILLIVIMAVGLCVTYGVTVSAGRGKESVHQEHGDTVEESLAAELGRRRNSIFDVVFLC